LANLVRKFLLLSNHSRDPHQGPQDGVDIAEVKRLVGDKVCLLGNVNCGLVQTGSDAEVADSAHYALDHGKPGGGYVFCTSNCIYTGMALPRYEQILDIWQSKRDYPK
jgi:uroporphyrinogen decarboxylase